jgi:hypothetical protein
MLHVSKNLSSQGALAALFLFVSGVGCNGFLVNPTLTSIAVGQSATISQNGTVQMSAVGTYNDGSTQSLSNVLWSSSVPVWPPSNAKLTVIQ